MNAIFSLSLLVISADPDGRLQFDKTSIDRGEVKAGVPLVETIKLTNPTPKMVSVTALTATCGCLKPKISSQRISPGGSAEIRFEINTLSQPVGPNRWKLFLRYRPEDGPEIDQTLELTAKLTREVTVEPCALVVVTPEGVDRDIVLKSDPKKPIVANRVASTIPHLSATLAKPKQGNEIVQTVRLRFPADAPPGDHVGTLSLFTEDPDHAEIRVPIQIVKRSPKEVQASPEELSLRLAADQNSVSGIVRLKDGEDREVVVEKAEADHPAFGIKHVPGPGRMSTLRITITPDANARRGESVVRVTLKSPEGKVVTIPVRWE